MSTIQEALDLKPEAEEIEFLRQIAELLGVARSQAELFAQMPQQVAPSQK
ncbi:hypothetical protein Q5691_19110 [Microcoleus sp. w1-18aA5]